MSERRFRPDAQGYIRHWILAGPQTRPYTGTAGSDDQMRRQAVDHELAALPEGIGLGQPGPFGEPWRFHWPGFNVFVEQSAFYHQLEVLDLWAATQLHVPTEWRAPCRLWAVGTLDLWVNEAPLVRHDVPRYMFPQATQAELPLKEGMNRLCVRLQGLGVRDTRFLFGMQVLDGVHEIEVSLAGSDVVTGGLAAAEEWLLGVRAAGDAGLVAATSPKWSVQVAAGGQPVEWAQGTDRFVLGEKAVTSLSVRLSMAGKVLERTFELPENRVVPTPPTCPLEAHQRNYLEHIAAGQGSGRDSVQTVLARHLTGPSDRRADDRILQDTLRFIDDRNDCADFALAAVLRLWQLDALPGSWRERVEQTLLGFRYWHDETGTDAMCFGSENHSLLFHGCQLLAGQLLPARTFPAAKRSGSEQAALGAERCRGWLERVEARGYLEFLSSTYLPITVAALMNLVDFAADDQLRRRAALQVDALLRDLARHSFDGVFVAPQGRVYRGILAPETSTAQALLSYCTTAAVPAHTGWAPFLASSPRYRPPSDLAELMRKPVSATLRHEKVVTRLEKTAGYMLCAGELKRGDLRSVGQFNALAGAPGYQEHAWHATLGRRCHVFVNHPGAHFDLTMSRPGYWYGNGILPELSQRGSTLVARYDIPPSHPVNFTHAHWPSGEFTHEEVTDHWAFGAHGAGYIALWCSRPLRRHDEVLAGRELRADGRQATWICHCAEVADRGSFETFRDQCLAAGVAPEGGTIGQVAE
ncbi:MAG: hypothetical protein COY42_17115 [Armatimonadetes bacterium CG_4_10_14_0_8_um_filter_66_14]|nr:hypothetical protein [Armatimonadota bacterium]OIO92169.1 MAG: hypothetical protein AUJ96_32815 [Armatimonadetes bacterium CG2_30_66_41]PIU95846.1 MAG: hypothetical protein COS65_00415 [Armatimonadetes bacterium CG06_land_8_20_14_3_00_66_21]PIZ42687.1 MAG: hypothetical protein COY42_17115 [Armatimonadetes bacterium CG_4_10_14_0_8_um_filter_66_14]NCP31616.1 hypothetical protein [Armatimonadota bacterium]